MLALTEGISPHNMVMLYADPYIARVGHDHRPAGPIYHERVTYLSAWVRDVFVGAFMVVRGAVDFELHALLKRAALPHSRELGRMCIAWAFRHPIQRVTVQIMAGFESVVNYCLRLGFKREGVKRAACVRNGVPTDVYLLGIVREEWAS